MTASAMTIEPSRNCSCGTSGCGGGAQCSAGPWMGSQLQTTSNGTCVGARSSVYFKYSADSTCCKDCISIPLKSGGSLSLKWTRLGGQEAAASAYTDTWMPAGAGAVFSFLPRVNQNDVPAGGQRLYEGFGTGTVSFDSTGAVQAPLSQTGQVGTTYFTTYDQLSGTYYEYFGGSSLSTSDWRYGRVNRRYDLKGNEIQYSYRANSGGTKALLRTLSGDITSNLVTYFGYSDETIDSSHFAPISKIALLDQVTPQNTRAVYFEYATYRDLVSLAYYQYLSKIINPSGCVDLYDPVVPFNDTTDVYQIKRDVDAEGYVTYFNYTAGNLNQVAEPEGRITYYEYPLQSQTRMIQQGRPMRFIYYSWDASRDMVTQMNQHTDPLGNTTYFVYDVNLGRMTKKIDPNRNLTSYEYGASGGTQNKYALTRWVRELDNAQTYFGYNSDTYDLVKKVGPRSQMTYYAYDTSRNLVQTIDALGNQTLNGPDSLGRLEKTLDARGNPTYFNYSSASGSLDSRMDALGNVAYHGYDSFRNQTRDVSPRWRESTFQAFATYYEYDALNRRTKTVDPLGNVTYHDYTSRGNLLDTVDALGTVTAQTFNGLNLRTQTTVTDRAGKQLAKTQDGFDVYMNRTQTLDARGNATYFFFDELDRLTAQKNAMGEATYYLYDSVGNRTSVRDALQRTTQYFYDLASRLVAGRDALANQTYFFYDLSDNVSVQVNSRLNPTYFFYDLLDRRQATRDALGSPAYFFYDPVGNQSVMMNARFAATYFGYDALNRNVRTQDTLGKTTYYTFDASGNRTRMIDARGSASTATYDALNRTSVVQDALGNPTYFFYDAVGNQTVQMDARFNSAYFFYDGLRRTTARRNALANSSYFYYDPAGNQSVVTDPRANSTYFAYDALNRRSATQDALANVTYYFFDTVGNSSSVKDARKNTSYFGYDAVNRPTASLDPLQNATYFFYDQVGNRTKVIDARLATTYFGYDALNRASAMQDALANSTYYFYDVVGNRTVSVNARQKAAYFGYDLLNRQTAMQDALGNTTYYVYDAVGNRRTVIDAKGAASATGYDALNRQNAVGDGVGNATLFRYDAAGNLSALDRGATGYGIQPYGTSAYGGADGVSTYFYYDAVNRRAATRDALGNTGYFGYDAAGNTTAVRNPLLHGTYFGYDALNRMVRVQDALGAATYFTYDEVGNRTSVLDPDLHALVTGFDALNRPSAVLAPDAGSTYYFYDRVSNRTRDLDPRGNTTYYGYDVLKRPVRIQDALGKTIYFEYDQVGNRTKLIDSEGASTAAAFDAVNRATDITYTPAGAIVSDGLKNTYFVYDQVGNVTQRGDLWGLSRMAYNGGNRLTQTQFANGNVVYFRYDTRDNVTARVYPGIAGTSGAAYDSIDRQTHVQAPSGATSYFTYDAASNLTQRLLGDGLRMDATYDAAERLSSWRYSKSNNAPLTYFDYTRDAKGLVTKAVREATYTQYFSYDASDRLLSEIWGAGSTEVYGYRYAYDLAGNRTKARVNGSDTYYSYDAANQRTKKGSNALFASATYYTYDKNGSLTDLVEPGGTTKFAYNPAGLVARMKWKDASSTYFFYDAMLRRYALSQNGTLNYFLWDGSNLLQKLSAAGAVQEEYTNAKSPITGIGQFVEVNRPGSSPQKLYPVMDPRGTITKYLQSDGTTVQASREYDAFGNLIPNAASGTWPGFFGYQGQAWQEIMSTDSAQRLLLSPTRLYDPVDGSFLSRDPNRLSDPKKAPGQVQPFYLYGSANPILYVDPDGKLELPAPGVGRLRDPRRPEDLLIVMYRGGGGPIPVETGRGWLLEEFRQKWKTMTTMLADGTPSTWGQVYPQSMIDEALAAGGGILDSALVTHPLFLNVAVDLSGGPTRVEIYVYNVYPGTTQVIPMGGGSPFAGGGGAGAAWGTLGGLLGLAGVNLGLPGGGCVSVDPGGAPFCCPVKISLTKDGDPFAGGYDIDTYYANLYKAAPNEFKASRGPKERGKAGPYMLSVDSKYAGALIQIMTEVSTSTAQGMDIYCNATQAVKYTKQTENGKPRNPAFQDSENEFADVLINQTKAPFRQQHPAGPSFADMVSNNLVPNSVVEKEYTTCIVADKSVSQTCRDKNLNVSCCIVWNYSFSTDAKGSPTITVKPSPMKCT